MSDQLAAPVPAKILEHGPYGSCVVEVPISVETPVLNFSKTAGGGKPNGSLTRDDLLEMVENFPASPGPVAVNFGGHGHDDSRPADAFIESVKMRGKELWARIKVTAVNRAAELAQDMWRGFSITFGRDLVLPDRAVKGCMLRSGGTFTNNPATATHFRISEVTGNDADNLSLISLSLGSLSPSPHPQEGQMADEQKEGTKALADLTSTLTAKDARIQELNATIDAQAKDAADLRTKITDLTVAKNRSETDASGARIQLTQRDSEITDLKEKLERRDEELSEAKGKITSLTQETKATRVLNLVRAGLRDRDIPPAVFEGFAKDPVAFLNTQFGGSVESLTATIEKFPKLKPGAAHRSGHVPAEDGEGVNDGSATLTKEDAKTLRGLSLDPKFAGVESEADLVTLREADKK